MAKRIVVGLVIAEHIQNRQWQRLRELLATWNFKVRDLQAGTIRTARIPAGVQVLLLPGGTARAQARALGETGQARVREAVEKRGMGYIGICAGAWLARKATNRLGLVDAQSPFGGEGTSYRGQQREVIIRISGNAKSHQVFDHFAARKRNDMKYVIPLCQNG